MKKRLFAVLLSLSLVSGLFCPVFADVNTVQLTEDTTVGATIVISTDTTYDLNGYTLSLDPNAEGSVFHVQNGAALTIEDSSTAKTGRISGGKSLSGTLKFEADEYGYNRGEYLDSSDGLGGGVYVESGAELEMTGGTITDNYAEQGAGVYLESGAELHVSGTASVIGNYSDEDGNTANNVFLPLNDNNQQSAVIVDDELSDSARIGVTPAIQSTTSSGTPITQGLSGNGKKVNFITDEDGKGLFAGASGEAVYTTVERPKPTVDELPSASPVVSGQTLATSTFTGGKAIYNDTEISGTYTWLNPSIVPTADNNGYSVIFTPDDTSYDDVIITVIVTFASGSSGGSEGSASGVITVPVSGDDNTVNVKVSVTGNTAKIEEADISSVVSKSADTGTVAIDLSGLNKEINNVVIPASMVKTIANAVADTGNDADGMEIRLSTGSLVLDADALKAVTEQMSGSDLTLNLDDIKLTDLNSAQQGSLKNINVQVILDIYLSSKGQRISDFKGGSADISVPYKLKNGQAGQGVTVWYAAESGSKEEIPAYYDGRNTNYSVNHLSNYVIAYDETRAVICPKDTSCPISAFPDTRITEWYHDGIHYALEHSIMNGVGSGRFDPEGTASRAMIAQILYNLEGKPAGSPTAVFSDIIADEWYVAAINWANDKGIIGGYGSGLFGPDDDVTREQLVTILHRYAQFKGIDVSKGKNISNFTDHSAVSDWAFSAMKWSVGHGLVNGKTATTLNPADNATRAEIATIIMRYCENIVK